MFPIELDTSILAILALGSIILTLIVTAGYIILARKYRSIFKKTNSVSIDEVLLSLIRATEDLEAGSRHHEKVLESHDARIRASIKRAEVIRFNAWDDIKGEQSFTTSFINENGDGVIVSSLYARDKTSIFAKPVNAWTTNQTLTDEEKEILENSKK
ncbi:MAG: DUF4446 family protein [Minisyncoccia bacterium]